VHVVGAAAGEAAFLLWRTLELVAFLVQSDLVQHGPAERVQQGPLYTSLFQLLAWLLKAFFW
jgi:hypothetical protein